MSSAKVSKSVINQILLLNRAGKTDREIAQELNIKRLQVSAVVAHVTLRNEPRAEPTISELPDEIAVAEAVAESDQLTAGDEASASVDEAEAEAGIYVGDDAEYGDPLYW